MKPLIIAHRGYSAKYPQNTMAAFNAAATVGADGIEFDIWLCASGEIVITHDLDIAQHSDGKGKVWNLKLSELSRYNFAQQHPAWKQFEKIPTLEEVLAICASFSFINIEIKSFQLRTNGIEKKLTDFLHQHPLVDKIVISSFNPRVLFNIKKYLPNIKRGLLLHRRQIPKLSARFLSWITSSYSIHLPNYLMLPRILKLAENNHLLKLAWTVNDLSFLQKCLELNMDAIITDDPVWAKNILNCHPREDGDPDLLL